MAPLTIDELMTRLPQAFVPEKAGDLEATVQFYFTGERASDWWVVIRDGTCLTGRGEKPAPNVTIKVDGQDYIDLVNGDLNPLSAFMQGKLIVSGDVTLAMRLRSLFEGTGNTS
jgi:putative sterol carrier protein